LGEKNIKAILVKGAKSTVTLNMIRNGNPKKEVLILEIFGVSYK
jgi:hypothetical protein